MILIKSVKLKPVCGVWGAPGVFITDDGRADEFDGGVVGVNFAFGITPAGEGDVARYIKRSAPRSPAGLFAFPGLAIRLGGVRGGLEWKACSRPSLPSPVPYRYPGDDCMVRF